MRDHSRIACQYVVHPVEVLQSAGLSNRSLGKLRRFQGKQEQQGAAVVVLHWPDHTWCVLAQHYGPLALAIALDDDTARAAYEDARLMLRDGYLPKLVARFHSYH